MSTSSNSSGSIDTMQADTSTLAQVWRDYRVILVLLAVMLVATTVLAPVFFSPQNLINVARQASITGVVAVGMTFVILTAGIDLSVGAILALTGVVMSLLIKADVSVYLALPTALLVGMVCGMVNGFGSTFLGIQPFIMTLATMAVCSGIGLLISNGTPIQIAKEASDNTLLSFLGNGNIGGVPGPVIVFAIVAAVATFTLRYVPFGRFVYGIGGGVEAARLSGVPTARILILVYAISGLCAAMAGAITTSRLFVGHPTAGSFIMLDSIAAVVIGGTSLMGGRGSVIGTVAGVFLLAMVANLLNLLGVSPFNQQIAKGAIIILAVLFTAQGLRLRIMQQWNAL